MKKNKGIISISAFRHALKGFWRFIREERHAKIHVSASIVVVAFGMYIKLSQIEWSIILLTIALVFVSEMVNTSIEKTCDLIDNHYNLTIKTIKDIAAGAVLFASFIAVIIALLIFLPKCI